MNIHVYGTDLTAWTAASCLAQAGNEVLIVEWNSEDKTPLDSISVLKNEPGLYDLTVKMIASGRLSRGTPDENNSPEVHWLALKPTEQKNAVAIAKKIADTKSENILVVNQCNFGVGSTDLLQSYLDCDNNQVVVCIPDYLQEGHAITGFSSPKRITLGSENSWGLSIAQAVIRPFSKQIEHLQIMTAKEAEFTKFAVTGMLALRLGYVNELANLADNLDVDIEVIRDSMGADPRIGSHYLYPGCGFGGLNFSEYLSRFSDIFEQSKTPSLVKTVVNQNEVQKDIVFRKLWQHYSGNLKEKTVTVWGAAFKPETASIDNGPSLKLIEALLAQSVKVHVHDPQALKNIREYFKDHLHSNQLFYHSDKYEALTGSEALLLVTEWSEYWSPDYRRLTSLMSNPLIIDGRNIYDKAILNEYGIAYKGIGR